MNTYNSFNVMLDNKNTAANYTIAAVLTMYKIFLQVFMYPVFRCLDVLFAMQNYSAAGLCALYHVALKKEAVR